MAFVWQVYFYMSVFRFHRVFLMPAAFVLACLNIPATVLFSQAAATPTPGDLAARSARRVVQQTGRVCKVYARTHACRSSGALLGGLCASKGAAVCFRASE